MPQNVKDRRKKLIGSAYIASRRLHEEKNLTCFLRGCGCHSTYLDASVGVCASRTSDQLNNFPPMQTARSDV